MEDEKKLTYQAVLYNCVDNATFYKKAFQDPFSALNHVLYHFTYDRLGFLVPYGVVKKLDSSTQKWMIKSILVNPLYSSLYKRGREGMFHQWKVDYYDILDTVQKRVVLKKRPSPIEIQKELEDSEMTYAVLSYLHRDLDDTEILKAFLDPPGDLEEETEPEAGESEPQFDTDEIFLNSRYQGAGQLKVQPFFMTESI